MNWFKRLFHRHQIREVISNRLQYQKGSRGVIEFTGRVEYCLVPGCDYEKFIGDVSRWRVVPMAKKLRRYGV